MTRTELETWLRETDRTHVEQIRQLTDEIAAEKDPEQKTGLAQFLAKLVERHMEFGAVIFEADDGTYVSLMMLAQAST